MPRLLPSFLCAACCICPRHRRGPAPPPLPPLLLLLLDANVVLTATQDEQLCGQSGGEWGIRDVSALDDEAARHGLRRTSTEYPVGPAKNFLLQYVKQ